MMNALQKMGSPVSGKALESFLQSLSKAMKESGVKLNTEDVTQLTRDQNISNDLKVHFCIGINSVTRVLERMPNKNKKGDSLAENLAKSMESSEEVPSGPATVKSITLQAIVVATDVQPKILVSHLEDLCKSRGVPILSINGGEGMGSLRLGETLGLRTAIVIGVKTGTSPINRAVQAAILTK